MNCLLEHVLMPELIALAMAFSFPAQAETIVQGGIRCTDLTGTSFPSGNGSYPADGHMWECVPHVPFVDENTVLSSVQAPKSAYEGKIGTVGELKKQGAIFYHFNSQGDAVSFLEGRYGSKSMTIPPTSSRCGYTGLDLGFAGVNHLLVSSIFEFCHYTRPSNLGRRGELSVKGNNSPRVRSRL